MNGKKIWVNSNTAFLVIILVLVLTACGTQSQAAAEPDKVSLQLNWVFQAQFAGYFVAQEEGLYEAENLDVDIIPGTGTFRPIDKVISKEVDFAVVTDPIEILQAREAGHPIIAVAAIYQKNANIWVSLAEKNITKPQDMVGKRIGTRPVGEVAYRILLAAANVDQAEVKDNEVIIEDFTIRPIIEGQVDVMHDYALSGPLLAKRQGLDLNIITLADQGVFLQNELLVVHEDFLKANPDLVKRFVQASLKGWDIAVKEPEKGVEATLKFDETLDAAHQTDMMAATIDLVDPQAAPVGHMDEKIWQQTMQIALDQGLISKPVDLNEIYSTEFFQQ
jgi:ABC-type nitrate/sulfonate/bicarbonate transport system substrate-binding protein